MTELQQARINAHLEGRIIFQGKNVSKREMISMLKSQGAEFVAKEVPKIEPLSRMAFHLANNQQQRAHEKRMKEAGNKTVYEAVLPDGIIYDISKIQFTLATS